MNGIGPNPTPGIAELYPAACVTANDLGEIIGVPQRAVRQFTDSDDLLEPQAVLEIASQVNGHYRIPRSLNEIAGEMIARCAEVAPDGLSSVEDQIDGFFSDRISLDISPEQVVAGARRYPRRIRQQIERAYGRTPSI